MTPTAIFASRLISAFLPAPLLLLLVPAAAQAQDRCTIQADPTADTVQYSRPDDPWIYRGTDIPVDQNWLFGELPSETLRKRRA